MHEGVNNKVPRSPAIEKPTDRRSGNFVAESTPLLNSNDESPSDVIGAQRRALRALSIGNALKRRNSERRDEGATDVDFVETIPSHPEDDDVTDFEDTIPSEFPTLTTVVKLPDSKNSRSSDMSDTSEPKNYSKNPKKGLFRSAWGRLRRGAQWVGNQLARYQVYTEKELDTLNKARYGNRGHGYGAQYRENTQTRETITHEVPTLPLSESVHVEPAFISEKSPDITPNVPQEHEVHHAQIPPIAIPYVGTKEGRVPVWAEPVHTSTFDDPRPFLESLYPSEASNVSISSERIPVPISYEQARAKLDAVERKTKSIRASLIEKLGTQGKEFLSLADKGAQFFKENVGWKTRVFAGAGLLTSAALSVYAAPVVLTALGVTSLSMRVISASSTYLVLKKVLDKNFETQEKMGAGASEKKKVLYGIGAMLIAGLTGQAVGHLVEGGIPQSVRDMFHSPSAVATPEVVTDAPVADSPTSPAIAPESVKVPEIADIPLEVTHVVSKGDSLWSILRENLSRENFEDFKKLTVGAQERIIQTAVNKISEDPESYGIESGNIHKLSIGNVFRASLPELFKN